MKRFLRSAVGVASAFLLALSAQPTKAQVWLDFSRVDTVKSQSYQSIANTLDAKKITVDSLTLPGGDALAARDNGFTKNPIQLPFNFEYDGEVRTKLWIFVNGFISFNGPINTPTVFSQMCFQPTTSNNILDIVAPYWGDHFYGIEDDYNGGYKVSEIWYKDEGNSFCVEWKNINLNLQNIKDASGNLPAGKIPYSYGNFQLRLYKSTTTGINQGDIEFAYGLIDGDPGALRLKDAAIGIRGSVGDYMNGLAYTNNIYNIRPVNAKDSTTRSTFWQPSGGTDWRIRFFAIPRYYLVPNWGDGDADLSHAPIYKHSGLPQNQYVTPEDEKLILHSVATNTPLDPARNRQAYHGDVNHNGRYYYDSVGTKISIPNKDNVYTDRINVAPYNAIEKQIRFEVTAYDAALIMHYRGGAIYSLPWVLDTIPQYGKVAVYNADGFVAGNAVSLGNNTYRFPVYLNGTFNGPVGFNFNTDAEITSVEAGSADFNTDFEFSGNKVAVASDGLFSTDKAICYVTVKSDKNEINMTDVKLNDIDAASFKAGVFTDVKGDNDGLNSISFKNIVNGSVDVIANVAQAGNYQFEVYDMLGNRIEMISMDLIAGINNQNINTSAYAPGMYIISLKGNNVNLNSRFVVVK